MKLPPELLAHVPGCEDGSEPLRSASLALHAVNRTLRVTTKAGDYVVRLSSMPDAWLLCDRSQEFGLQAIAAEAGIAPPILYSDAARGWLVMPFLDEPVWTAANFEEAGRLSQLGAVLAKLHRLPAPASARLDVLATLLGYRSHLERAGGPPDLRVARWLDAAAGALRRLDAGGRAPAILHHDLHPANLLGERPWLIDWECAVVGDPLFDIACVLAYAPGSRAHRGRLLQAAGLGSADRSQLDDALFVFELHTWLWYRERALRIPPTAAERAAAAAYEARLG